METLSNIKDTVLRKRFIIFVVTGTQEPFDRLLKIIDSWASSNEGIEIIAQTAKSTFLSKNMTCFDYLEPAIFDKYFLRADIIIGHAGMGTIIKALENSKRLVIFPRIVKYNEHRNDHQYHPAKSLEKKLSIMENTFRNNIGKIMMAKYLIQSNIKWYHLKRLNLKSGLAVQSI